MTTPLPSTVYDELFRDSPPTPREEQLLDLLSILHLKLAHQLDFENVVARALGELQTRREQALSVETGP